MKGFALGIFSGVMGAALFMGGQAIGGMGATKMDADATWFKVEDKSEGVICYKYLNPGSGSGYAISCVKK